MAERRATRREKTQRRTKRQCDGEEDGRSDLAVAMTPMAPTGKWLMINYVINYLLLFQHKFTNLYSNL